MERYQGLIGVAVLLAIAWLLSNNRRRISPRIIIWGMLLQIGFAVLILKTPVGLPFFRGVDAGVKQLLAYAGEGSRFLFKPLDPRAAADYVEVDAAGEPVAGGFALRLGFAGTGDIAPVVQTLAFVVLPSVIFFSALLSILYHLGIMQWVVRGIAWVMQRTMGTSGAETLSVAGNIFVGQTEAPLLVRPFLPGMTKSELMCVMCGGFSTIAGGVMAIYVAMLTGVVENIAGHLMAASVMSAPAAIVMAKIIYPETEELETRGSVSRPLERRANVLQAAGDGAADGLQLMLNIGAMLFTFIALVALVNGLLSPLDTTLQEIFGVLLRPLAWCLGAPWDEAETLGTLLGEKLAVTELIAYAHLASLQGEAQLSERTQIIASYALCGFANFASIGIQMAGIGVLATERKADLAELALRAMIGGALASWMTAAIAGVLI